MGGYEDRAVISSPEVVGCGVGVIVFEGEAGVDVVHGTKDTRLCEDDDKVDMVLLELSSVQEGQLQILKATRERTKGYDQKTTKNKSNEEGEGIKIL